MYQNGVFSVVVFLFLLGVIISKKREMSQEIAHCDKKQGFVPYFLNS